MARKNFIIYQCYANLLAHHPRHRHHFSCHRRRCPLCCLPPSLPLPLPSLLPSLSPLLIRHPHHHHHHPLRCCCSPLACIPCRHHHCLATLALFIITPPSCLPCLVVLSPIVAPPPLITLAGCHVASHHATLSFDLDECCITPSCCHHHPSQSYSHPTFHCAVATSQKLDLLVPTTDPCRSTWRQGTRPWCAWWQCSLRAQLPLHAACRNKGHLNTIDLLAMHDRLDMLCKSVRDFVERALS
jgi:hypothetical protein